MRLSKAQTTAPVHALPALRFETQRLTAFSGLVLIQALLQRLRLKERLRQCLSPKDPRGSYSLALVLLQLVVHLMLGFRRLRDRDLYAKDPLLLRTLGVTGRAIGSTWVHPNGSGPGRPNGSEAGRPNGSF